MMAIGAVTALSPDEHITGMFTALEIEYAAANVGVAYNIHLPNITKYMDENKAIIFKKKKNAQNNDIRPKYRLILRMDKLTTILDIYDYLNPSVRFFHDKFQGQKRFRVLTNHEITILDKYKHTDIYTRRYPIYIIFI